LGFGAWDLEFLLPTKPAPSDELDAVLIRAQLNAPKQLLDDLDSGKLSLADFSAAFGNLNAVVQGKASQSDLASAIAGTSSNSNAIPLLALSVSDPPLQGQVQSIANKVDDLITALRR